MNVLSLGDYANDINLYREFKPAPHILSAGEKKHIIQELLDEVKHVLEGLKPMIPGPYPEDRKLLHAAINVLEPGFFNDDSIAKLDLLLQTELHEQVTVNVAELAHSAAVEIEGTKIILWQGDISTIKIDAVVNAANNKLLGCFQPLHKCIDNIIHSKAGVQLRDDCFKIMQKQNMPEPTGSAKITRAYNLPSSFVIHTVGPIVQGNLRPHHKKDLQKSYLSCLSVAKTLDQIKGIAFCGISTGVFGYPFKQAAEAAFHRVCGWLEENPGELTYLVFNVFTDRDRLAYESLIGER